MTTGLTSNVIGFCCRVHIGYALKTARFFAVKIAVFSGDEIFKVFFVIFFTIYIAKISAVFFAVFSAVFFTNFFHKG